MSGGWASSNTAAYGQPRYGTPTNAPPAQLSKGEFSVGSQTQDWYWYNNMFATPVPSRSCH